MFSSANTTGLGPKTLRAAGIALLLSALCAGLLLGCGTPEPEAEIMPLTPDPSAAEPASETPETEIVVISAAELDAFLETSFTPLTPPVEAPYIIVRNWGNEDDTPHYGIDYTSQIGDSGAVPLLAAAGGTVSLAETGTAGYGNYIILDHGNGLQTLYAHCDAFYVAQGDTVQAGQEIAAMGSSGDTTGIHVHFEVRVNGKNTNPADFFT